MTKTTHSRRILFTVIALLIPVLMLALIEVSLRLVGYGQTIDVFVTAGPNDEYRSPNPELIKRFFHVGAATPNVSPDSVFFKTPKPAQTLRLVLLGGSSAAGFPYGRFGSPGGMLQQQLYALYPERDIEVIPLAMSSINSYALRDMLDDVIAIQPDAVLIYAGHNEYLGVMGVGSAYANKGGHSANLLYLALKELRIFQLMQQLINPPIAAPEAGRTQMASMAREQNIPLDSALYKAGVEQFRDNLAGILSTLKQQSIPTFISSLASNEADQPPFASTPNIGDYSMDSLIHNRMALFAKQEQSKQWLRQQPDSANAHFTFATLSRNQPDLARDHFIQARDLDLLRFRAPSEFNQVIRDVAANNNATFVDGEHYIRQDNNGGLIGKQHMLEHLHPNARGYFLLSRAFLDALQQQNILPAGQALNAQQLWQHQPLNAVDELVAARKIARLTSDYPFKRTPQPVEFPHAVSVEEKLAQQRDEGGSWLSQQPVLLNYYQQQQRWSDAARIAATLYTALPFETDSAHVAAIMYLRSNLLEFAHYFARRAVAQTPSHPPYRLTYAEVLFKQGQTKAALAQLDHILQSDPTHQKALYYRQLITQGNS